MRNISKARAGSKTRFKRGDFVRELDGDKYGLIVMVLEDPDLVIVSWPPSREGFCYHRDDLVRA